MNNAPHITICLGSRGQILEGLDLLNRLLDENPRGVPATSEPLESFDPPPDPNNAKTADETSEEELTPGQKAARTRAANKAKKEAEQKAPATAQAPVAQPTQAPAPAQPQVQPQVRPQVQPGVPQGEITEQQAIEEARHIHARLAMEGRGAEMLNYLASFNVQRISDLNPAQRAEFIAHIRTL